MRRKIIGVTVGTPHDPAIIEGKIKPVKTVNDISPDENGNVLIPITDGEDGVSPTISVSTITGGHRITITDKNGTKNVDVLDGEQGDPGEKGDPGAAGRGIKSIARTSGNGVAGTTDTYTITYTDNTTSTFTISNGNNGNPGASVTVSNTSESSASGGSNVVTFSDGKTLTVKNGKDGTNGTQGFSIVASVDRPSFSTTQWNTYGEIGHEENWGSTSNSGVRVGDLFVVVGTATDTGIGHQLVYKYTGVKGGNTLSGECIAHHIVAYRGAKGEDGCTPKKGIDYFTPAEVAAFKEEVLESIGCPIFGVVDGSNNIVLSGDLADGTYNIKYEMADGSKVNIGNLVLDSNVYYSVTKNLTYCTINNSATKVIEGQSYSATITPNSGYTLKSVSVTMGGANVSVTNGVINIAKVTGNIVITAAAEVSKPTYTNLVPSATNLDGSAVANGYKRDTYFSTASTTDQFGTSSGFTTTGTIACVAANVQAIYVYGLNFTGASHDRFGVMTPGTSVKYTVNYNVKNLVGGMAAQANAFKSITKLADYYYKIVPDSWARVNGFAFSGATVSGVEPIVTINEPIF